MKQKENACYGMPLHANKCCNIAVYFITWDNPLIGILQLSLMYYKRADPLLCRNCFSLPSWWVRLRSHGPAFPMVGNTLEKWLHKSLLLGKHHCSGNVLI